MRIDRLTVLPALCAALCLAMSAIAQEKREASDPLKDVPSDKRDDWFKASPDPWDEITKLEYGGDRTFASTIQSQVVHADPKQYPNLEKRLLNAFKANGCTDNGREFVCRILALVGSQASVPVLAPLLTDEKASDMARYALERISDKEAGEALQAALGKANGKVKDGIAGSIAARRALGLP